MAALGSLVVSLSANTAEFTAGMDKAAYQTDKAMKQMRREAEMVGAAIGAMSVVGVGALTVMVKMTIDAADNLRDMAQKTGIAVETLNGLEFAARQAGGNMEALADGVKDLNKNIALAAGGDRKLVDAFNAIGLSVTDASGQVKSADVVLAEMADKFKSYADGPEKVALAMTLMGEGGLKMIPLLNDGGAAMRDNTEYAKKYSGMTAELTNESDNFNDTMGRLQLQQTSFANEMTKAVLPILQAVADETLNAAEQSDKFALAGAGVRIVLETLVVMGSEVAYTFDRIGNSMGGWAAQVSALGISFGDIAGGPAAMTVALGKAVITGDASFSRFKDINQMIKDDNEKAQKDHDAFLYRVLNPAAPKAFVGPMQPGGSRTAPRMLGGAGGKDPDADFKAYLKDLQGQIQKTNELTTAEKLLADVRNGQLTVGADQQAQLMLMAQEVDATKEAIRISTDRANQRRKDEQDSINALREIEAETARNARTYQDATAAAAAYIDTITRQNARELAGVGRGSKFRTEQSGISQIEDKQTTSRQALEADLRNSKISRAQFDLYLETVNSTYSQEIEAYRSRNAAITALQGDWTTGASEAFANYFDNVSNVAASTEQIFGSAFKGMEDAMVSFVKTGKLDFKSLTDSIITDLIRMAVQQSIMKPLTAGFTAGGLGGMLGAGASLLGLPSYAVGTEYVPRDMIAQIHQGERIIPAAQNNAQAQQQPIVVHQNFTVGDVASISMVRQAVAGSEKRIAGAMGRSMQYGGALA